MSDERIDERVAWMILNGKTPREVALQFPSWFLHHHEGAIRLWEAIHRSCWRGNE